MSITINIIFKYVQKYVEDKKKKKTENIQTESIQDRSVNPFIDTETGKFFPKAKHLAEKRNVKVAVNTSPAQHRQNQKVIFKKKKKNGTFGSTVVNEFLLFMSLLHMPLGKMCRQGKKISIRK